MAVNVVWEDEQKEVLLLVFDAPWTLRDFQNAVRLSYEMMDTVDHAVNVIIDLRKGKEFPSNFITSLRRAVREPHPHNGLMALVGVNSFIRAFFDVFRRLYPVKSTTPLMRMVADYDEAHAFFARAALPAPVSPPPC